MNTEGKIPPRASALTHFPAAALGEGDSAFRGEAPRREDLRWSELAPGPGSALNPLPGRETEAGLLGREGAARQRGQEVSSLCCQVGSGTPTLLLAARAASAGNEGAGGRCEGGQVEAPRPPKPPSSAVLAGPACILPPRHLPPAPLRRHPCHQGAPGGCRTWGTCHPPPSPCAVGSRAAGQREQAAQKRRRRQLPHRLHTSCSFPHEPARRLGGEEGARFCAQPRCHGPAGLRDRRWLLPRDVGARAAGASHKGATFPVPPGAPGKGKKAAPGTRPSFPVARWKGTPAPGVSVRGKRDKSRGYFLKGILIRVPIQRWLQTCTPTGQESKATKPKTHHSVVRSRTSVTRPIR